MTTKEDIWKWAFFEEVERLFNGLLPPGFNMDNITFDARMSATAAARDYFVGYQNQKMFEDWNRRAE